MNRAGWIAACAGAALTLFLSTGIARSFKPPANFVINGVSHPQASGSVPEALRNTGRILPRPAQTFRGWGMSLAWEANDLYGGDRQPAQIKDSGGWRRLYESQSKLSISSDTTFSFTPRKNNPGCRSPLLRLQRVRGFGPAQSRPGFRRIGLRLRQSVRGYRVSHIRALIRRVCYVEHSSRPVARRSLPD